MCRGRSADLSGAEKINQIKVIDLAMADLADHSGVRQIFQSLVPYLSLRHFQEEQMDFCSLCLSTRSPYRPTQFR